MIHDAIYFENRSIKAFEDSEGKKNTFLEKLGVVMENLGLEHGSSETRGLQANPTKRFHTTNTKISMLNIVQRKATGLAWTPSSLTQHGAADHALLPVLRPSCLGLS